MFVSVSRSTADADYAHTYVETVVVQNFNELAKVVCGNRRWSPITWAGGRRRQDDFEQAELVVLDFDDGKLTLQNAVDHFTGEGMRFILGTTKSHGIPKGTTAAQDRFRVVLHMDAPVTHLGRYKQNMRRIIEAYPADRACGDGARIYRPCQKIVAACDGVRVTMLPYQEPPPPRQYQRMFNQLPLWVSEVLSRDCPGERNSTVFRVAARMTSYGFSEADVRRIIAGSAISLPHDEMEAAIGSGIRRSKQG